MVWTFAYPPGYRACQESEDRTLFINVLKEKGFRVECRKEGPETILLTDFRLRNFNQFIWWAGNQSTWTIYEQPGYFWFLKTAPDGFVTYGY